jgi:hypothetical protein
VFDPGKIGKRFLVPTGDGGNQGIEIGSNEEVMMHNTPQAGSGSGAAAGASMMEQLRARIAAAATLKGIGAALALYLLSVAALSIADMPLGREAPGVTKPDLTFGYSYTQLIDILTAYGEQGRQAYAIGLVFDTIMPVFFAVVTILVAARAAPRWLGLLSVAPLVFMLFDVVENAAFGLMLAQFPAVSPELVSVTRVITMIKLSGFFVAMPTLVIGIIAIGIGLLRNRRSG